jgi:hypothetical protein
MGKKVIRIAVHVVGWTAIAMVYLIICTWVVGGSRI